MLAMMQSRPRSILVLPLLAATAALVALGWDVPPAAAQGYGFGYEQPRHRAKWKHRPSSRSRAARNRDDSGDETRSPGKPAAGAAKVAEAVKPKGPLFVVISIADQHVTIYNHDGVVTRSRVSTGQAGHPTPKGVFTIIGRERYHYSNIYGGAPMPFMQRVTWSGVAMHLGVVPGYPASHGCIRLPGGFAAQLWGLTKIGERIVISPREVTPSQFTHALLPVPKMQAQMAALDTGTSGAKAADTTATAQPTQVATAAGDMAPSEAPAPTPVTLTPSLLNPYQYADQLKVKAAADAATAAKAVKDTLAAASAKKPEAARAAADLKTAEAAHTSAQSKLASATKSYDTASPTAKEAASTAKASAEAALAEAATKLESARTASGAKAAELAEAVRLWKEATAASDTAAKTAREAVRRTSPVSVLISKKDQKVYVRQGLAPLFEAAASVRDPETPLGTHLYIATASKDDGASLAWSVVSLPAQAAEQQSERKKKKSSREDKPAPPAATGRQASSAAEALERVDIAQDVRDRISELLWTGGSLIVSDQPLSDETSDVGTDLVVKVR